MQVDSGGDPLGRKSPCWDASPPVTVTVVKQGVCRGTLTWMCCVRKWALRTRATPSKSPSFVAIFLIILILPAPSLCPGKVPFPHICEKNH